MAAHLLPSGPVTPAGSSPQGTAAAHTWHEASVQGRAFLDFSYRPSPSGRGPSSESSQVTPEGTWTAARVPLPRPTPLPSVHSQTRLLAGLSRCSSSIRER